MTDSAAGDSRVRKTVPLLMLVVACGHFNRISISVAGAERIIDGHGLSPERMGLVYSAFLLFYTLAMLPGGWFIDRFGARTALIAWGFGSVLFVGLTGGAGLFRADPLMLWLGLMAVRSLLGAFNAPLHPAAAHIVFEQVAWQSRTLANGLVTFAACIGIASTYYVMGFLIDWLDWPLAFVITSGMTLIVALIWTRGSREPRGAAPARKATTPAVADLLAVMRRRSVVFLTLSYTAHGYFQYLLFYWIEYFFEAIQSQDRSVARRYAMLVTLAMGAGMVAGGWLADRVSRSFSGRARRALVPALGMLGAGFALELGVLASRPQLTLVAFAVAAACIGACEGPFWTTSVALGGRFGGTAAGLMNTGGNIGGTLSTYVTPLLSGLFAAHYGADAGWRLSLAVAGCLVVVGAALWWGVQPDEPEDEVDARLVVPACD